MGRTLDEVLDALPKARRVQVERRYRELRRGPKRIVSKPSILGGEPVFKGTRISLANVSALIAKRVPLYEIAKDYAALSRADLGIAAIHSKMKRNPEPKRKPLRLLRRPTPAAKAKARSKRP